MSKQTNDINIMKTIEGRMKRDSRVANIILILSLVFFVMAFTHTINCMVSAIIAIAYLAFGFIHSVYASNSENYKN